MLHKLAPGTFQKTLIKSFKSIIWLLDDENKILDLKPDNLFI